MNKTCVYRLITMPRKGQGPAVSLSTGGSISRASLKSVILADAMVVRARHLGLMLWLWHSALRLLPTPHLSAGLKGVPALMIDHVTEMRTSLQLAERKLLESGWALRDDLILWLCSLISLAPTAEVTDYFVGRYLRAAQKLNMTNPKQLEDVLKAFAPVSSIDEASSAKLFSEMMASIEGHGS